MLFAVNETWIQSVASGIEKHWKIDAAIDYCEKLVSCCEELRLDKWKENAARLQNAVKRGDAK